MATKPTKDPQESTEQPQNAAIAPAVDPGPTLAFPAPQTGHPMAEQLFSIGRQAEKALEHIREEVQAISTLRHPPAVHSYKAEVLSWIDAMIAYRDRTT